MNEKIRSLNMTLSQIYKREDELYHRYSVYCGLSDPASWVLYTLYEDKNKIYTQNDLVSIWSYPKQTLNYAVGGLVDKGWVKLKQLPNGRNRKAIILTKGGEHVCEEKILPLMLAEERSLQGLNEKEQELLLYLLEKQYEYFKKEIEEITGD